MRAEKRGELEKLQCEMSEYLSFYNKTVEKLENDLSAIDHTLSLYEIKISSNKIPAIKKHPINSKSKTEQLNKFILDAISESEKGHLNMRELNLQIAAKSSSLFGKKILPVSVMNTTRYRVRVLCDKGIIEKMPKNRKGQYYNYKLVI